MLYDKCVEWGCGTHELLLRTILGMIIQTPLAFSNTHCVSNKVISYSLLNFPNITRLQFCLSAQWSQEPPLGERQAGLDCAN